MAFCSGLAGPRALRENNALELANQSARYICDKHKLYNNYSQSLHYEDIPTFLYFLRDISL